MKLHLTILIETRLKNSAIQLCVPDGGGGLENLELLGDSTHTLECHAKLDPPHWDKPVKLFRVSGLVPGLGQTIVIKGITINDRSQDPDSFFDLLDFSAMGNEFVPDHVITNCHEICFNGELLLAVPRNRDRIFWCPYYYSARKDDFVFTNMLLDEYEDDVLPYVYDPRPSKKRYLNRPHHEYSTDRQYDFACFGCSVTYGTGLSRRERWSDLLSPNSLNLAVPGLGMDGIFLNLKNALAKFQFRKVVVLLPNFERRLVRLRLPVVEAFCRIPVTASNMDWHHSRIKHWAWDMMGIQHDRAELEQWKKIYVKKCRDMTDQHEERGNGYGKRMLDRLLRLLGDSGKQFYLSAWDEEVYEHLRDRVDGDGLLPSFCNSDRPWGDRAFDKIHPGPHSHREWAELIAPIVKS